MTLYETTPLLDSLVQWFRERHGKYFAVKAYVSDAVPSGYAASATYIDGNRAVLVHPDTLDMPLEQKRHIILHELAHHRMGHVRAREAPVGLSLGEQIEAVCKRPGRVGLSVGHQKVYDEREDAANAWAERMVSDYEAWLNKKLQREYVDMKRQLDAMAQELKHIT